MNKYIEQIGQLFIIGFPGEEPSDEFLTFIEEKNIGGVILFGDNCKTTEIIKSNILKIKEASKNYHPFIAIDQEGGRVSRIKGVPAEIASAQSYGDSLGIERFVDEYTRSTYHMESLGLNMNLAPVCDLFLEEENSCLKERCFGKTPEVVIPFVTQSVEIARKSKILSCLKHFPGLGDSSNDPHLETTTALYDKKIWNEREKLVFEAGLNAGANMIMTTHMSIPEFDTEIVTGSSTIINDLIRNELNFDSVVITDDLTMHGADSLGDFGERTIKAFSAGHDILLFGQNTKASIEAFIHFENNYHKGDIPDDLISRSLERIASLKFKIAKSVLF